MTSADDEERIDLAGPRPDLTDDRVVVVTAGGRVQVRDAANGKIERTASVPAASGDTMSAYEGWLFSHDEADGSAGPQHIRATDLVGVTGSAIVQTLPGRLRALAGCGPERVCVVTGSDTGTAHTTVTGIDAARRATVWSATTRYGGDRITSAHGYTAVSATGGGFELFSPAGVGVFGSAAATGWLDAGTLLVDDAGVLSAWSVGGARPSRLGRAPETIGTCTSTSSRLVCVTPGSLRTWRFR